jgi:hypothetical protein
VADLHEDWLSQVETEGPFLALPVVRDIWPDGVDRLGDADDRMVTFKQAFVTWQHEVDAFALADRTPEVTERYAAVTRAWIETVLDELAGWGGLRIAGEELPGTLEIRSPGEQIAVRPSGALRGRDSEYAALLLVSEPTTSLRDTGLDGWAATEIDRMAMLLRKAQVEVGIVTDGQWWAIVWAKDGKPTGSAMVNALTWAEEPLLRDAFLTLIDQRRFRAKDTEQRLPRLFERSELEAEEITEALGTQVRRSVELLVQAFSEARLAAARNGDPDPLTDVPDEVYQAAVTVMMRVVFLLFAEEREMLPTEQLYWDSYAIRDLLTDLEAQAANGEGALDESFDAWHRLLAVSQALYAGVNYDEMRMPAYGGSLLDPDRFPWLYATDQRGLRLKVSDRVMMHVLESVQTAVVRGERRRVSFRDIDVEQIGYIYEGLLGYSCAIVEDEVVLGLVGRDGEEPEIDASTLQGLYDDTSDAKSFAAALLEWIKTDQPAAKCLTAARLAKLYDAEVDEADMRRLLTPVAGHDEDLLGFLIDWSPYIRRDLRGIPLVIPVGGLLVVETPSRKNAGAHYTPRSLAEEVVLYALQPLVYDPGPLQTNDENAWRLKSSSEILDLKVADIAAGSGAFLVAAARYLADRVTEAWIAEGVVAPAADADPQLARDQAIREVIARCLYGADINPMAVEMCKLSLWLVSMDKTKPFSFVDDKIFCGNSLLGVTDLDQLRYLHLYPDAQRMDTQLLVDIDGKIAEATRLRKELASPVVEHDPMRSTRGKQALLEQLHRVTADLRLVADSIIAAGLPLGGKPGRQLDDAYVALSWELSEAFPPDGSTGSDIKLQRRLGRGLTPTVQTDYDRWDPLHWILEAPDVMITHQGFDAIVGNPPFLGGPKLRSALGEEYRSWLVDCISGVRSGKTDLVAYFFVRAVSLLNQSGWLGLIATNTIAQGDTRAAGLDPMVAAGFTITRAIRSRPWPSRSANLEFAAVWGTCASLSNEVMYVLDEEEVPGITTLLEPRGRSGVLPLRLIENRGQCFNGMKIYGKGFIISEDLARDWIRADPSNRDVLFPCLSGEDLNSSASLAASRWAIDFNSRTQEEARVYRLPFEHVLYQVKPERDNVRRQAVRDRWWLYGDLRPALRRATSHLDEVLVVAAVSKFAMFGRVARAQVLSHRLNVVASDSYGLQAVLSSCMHQLWIATYGATLESRLAYTPSDVFDTYAFPELSEWLEAIGEALDDVRREIMRRRGLGLTGLYNLINDSNIRGDLDTERMRGVHVEVDEATMSAYGWDDVSLEHGFHTYRQMERWTVSPAARTEILDRLLELNHERARAEGQHVPEQDGLF